MQPNDALDVAGTYGASFVYRFKGEEKILELLSVVAITLGALSLGVSAVVWVKLEPRALLSRLREVEAQQPRYHQELSAWTVATERMLEECEIKLKKAHTRKGGRPAREPEGPPSLPASLPLMNPGNARNSQLAGVRAELRRRGVAI